jgi:hypothetical protein
MIPKIMRTSARDIGAPIPAFSVVFCSVIKKVSHAFNIWILGF